MRIQERLKFSAEEAERVAGCGPTMTNERLVPKVDLNYLPPLQDAADYRTSSRSKRPTPILSNGSKIAVSKRKFDCLSPLVDTALDESYSFGY